jgi:hypothetical protein
MNAYTIFLQSYKQACVDEAIIRYIDVYIAAFVN